MALSPKRVTGPFLLHTQAKNARDFAEPISPAVSSLVHRKLSISWTRPIWMLIFVMIDDDTIDMAPQDDIVQEDESEDLVLEESTGK